MLTFASPPHRFCARRARTGSARREVRIGACSVVARRHTLLRSFFFPSPFFSLSLSLSIDRTRCHSCGLLRGRNCKTVTHVSHGTTSIRVEIVRSSDMNTTTREREPIKCHPISSSRWMTSGSSLSSRMQRAFCRRLPTTLPRISQS